MLCAAIAGFATVVHTGNDWLGAGQDGCKRFSRLSLALWSFGSTPISTGPALSVRASALPACMQARLPERAHFPFRIRDIPFLGTALFKQHPMVYFAFVLTAAIIWFLYRTRAGLVLRSVGESPESAHSLGYPVRRIRLLAVMFGGAMCGLAGAYLAVIYTPLWVEGMVSGKGWIALALTTFATWRPMRVLFGAYLFGGVTMMQFHLQSQGVDIPSQFLSMAPYVATIVVLALISRNPTWIRINMPALASRFSRLVELRIHTSSRFFNVSPYHRSFFTLTRGIL